MKSFSWGKVSLCYHSLVSIFRGFTKEEALVPLGRPQGSPLLKGHRQLQTALNRASRAWHTRIVTLNGVKGLAVRFFAALRMTVLRNSMVKCTNVLNSGLACSAALTLTLALTPL